MAAGESDPVVKGEGTGVQRIAKNLLKIGDKSDMSEVVEGTVVTLNNTYKEPLDAAKDFKHTGLIIKVVRDENGNVTDMTMVDSGGTPGSGSSGPRVSSLMTNGTDNYWGKRITGFYKWDTKPDGAAPANTSSAIVNAMYFSDSCK